MKLLLRFDVDSIVGMGHAKRCIALIKYLHNISELDYLICTKKTDEIQEILAEESLSNKVIFKDSNSEEQFITRLVNQQVGFIQNMEITF